jgi:hypothetical protein
MGYPNNLGYIYIDMKFEDILGKNLLNEDWKEDYKKVSYKVKLMYKTLRKGGFKIGNLIPDMVPFWSGFEIIYDKDTLITYELPTKYHLTLGNQVSPYWLVITGITINCEKHPHLGDDIDIREDILRRLSRKFNNALKGTFDEGEEIKIEVWRKPDLSSDFENTIDESVGESPNEQQRIVNKTKLVYKTFRKGKVKVRIPPIFNNGETVVVMADYELPTKFKIRLDFENSWNRPVQIFVPIEDVKIEFDFKSKNDAVQNELLQSFRHKIKMRFVNYDSDCDIHFMSPSNSIKNTEDHIVKEDRLLDKPNEDFSEIVKKAPTVYKALKKGTVTMDIETYHLGRVITPKKVTINYMLSDLYKVETDPFENNYNVKILIPTMTLDCPEEPELNNNQKIKLHILDIVKKKFNNFGLTIFLRPSHFYLKHNGTWVNL